MSATSHRFPLLVALILSLSGAVPAGAADYPSGDPPDTVPFGEIGTLPDYELRLIDFTWDGEPLLRTYHPSMGFTSDTAWIMIRIEATLTGSTTASPGDDLWFTLRDVDGAAGGFLARPCDQWPFPPDAVRLASGETASFNLCFELPQWMAMPSRIYSIDGIEITYQPDRHIELIAHTDLITDQWPVPFSLHDPGSDDDSADCACLPPPCGCLQPPENDLA